MRPATEGRGGTHGAGGRGRAPLRRGDHVRGEALRGVRALADLLLDQVHGQGELLPAQLAHLLGVRQAPGESGRGPGDSVFPPPANT